MQRTCNHRPILNFLFCFIFLIGFSFLLIASPSSEDSTYFESETKTEVVDGYPLTITDDLGYEIIIESKPENIASLTLFSDELLFDLVDSSSIGTVTFLATDPMYSNVAEKAQAIPNKLDLNVEQLIAINPDVVFVANWSESDKVQQLRQVGILVYAIETPFTIDGIYDAIRDVALVVGEQEAGERVITIMEEKILSVREALANLPSLDQKNSLEYNSWGTSAGTDTTWNEVLRLARVENAAVPFVADGFGMVPMSKELIVELNPDILFVPGYIYGDPNGAEAFLDSVLSDPAFSSIRAIEQQQVHAIPENLKSTYSQYFADTVLYVARLIYPDYF